MNKTLLTIMIAFIGSLAVSAKSLVLTLADGSSVYYQLSGETNPVMHFNGNKIAVDADSYSFTDFVNFCISEEDAPEETDVDGIEMDDVKPSFVGETLTLPVGDNGSVKIVDTKGMVYSVRAENYDGRCIVDLSGLPAGMYIISTQKATVKITRK